MKVKVGYFKDNDKEWASLLLDNISVCQQAVKDIVGNTIIQQTLHVHGLYSTEMDNIINIGTAKKVFANLVNKMHDGKTVIMNIKGGCTDQDRVDWNMVEVKEFDVDYKSSLLDLLKKENGVTNVDFLND